MGCSQASPELLAALEQNTAAVKSLSERSSATSEPQQALAPSQPEHNIVDYQIVNTTSAKKLEAKVKGLMTEGWQPLGGHQFMVRWVGHNANARIKQNYYQQTMVRYGHPKEKEDKTP